MKKRQLIFMLAACAALVIGGCSRGENNGGKNAAGETYNIVWYQQATSTRDNDLVFQRLSEYTAEKIGATVTCIPIRVTEYGEKIKMVIAAKDDMDMCFASSFSKYASDGAYLELNELLNKDGKDILNLLPDFAWKATSIDEKIYAVPSLKDWPTHWIMWYYKTFADKYDFDMDAITRIEDLEPVLQTIKDNEPEIVPLATTGNTSLFRFLPFETVSGSVVCGFREDDYSIVNIYETAEAKSFFKLMRSWYQKGFFRKDAATLKNSQDLIAAKKIFMDYGQTLPYYEDTLNAGADENMYKAFVYNLSKPKIYTSSLLGSVQAISANSKNPSATMKFMNLLFSDKYVMNTVTYGIEGKHYNVIDDKFFKYPEGVSIAGDNDYYGVASGQGNRYLLYVQEGIKGDIWDKYQEFNENAEISDAFGFVFNESAVSNELSAIRNVYNEFIPALLVGAVDPDEYLPKAIEKFEIAGVSKVIDEVKRQYGEWKTKNK